jgi:hypothetical protein
MDGITHRVAEERSLALHREVARRLRATPKLLERARQRVARWQLDGSVVRPWADAWADVLARPLDQVIDRITDPGQEGRDLRQTSPFAGVIDSATRWQILRDCERDRRRRDQRPA